jgi:hypothetical protein
MRPKLIPPGTKRLKLKYDKPLLYFAFKFNLRRYIMEFCEESAGYLSRIRSNSPEAGAYTRPLFS